MNSKVLTGVDARKVLRGQKTKGKCGYFELMEPPIGSWFVWDHRGKELRGIRLDSEEAVKKWLL